MKRYKIAAILIFIHGFVEICVGLGFIPLWLSDFDTSAMGQYFVFIVPYLQENLYLMSILSMIYGSVRLVGAVGLWKNRMWGFVISVINCITTMVLMIFMLPAGIMDGIFSCSSLLLIMTEYFGNRQINE